MNNDSEIKNSINIFIALFSFFSFFFYSTICFAMVGSGVYFEAPNSISSGSDFTVSILLNTKEPINALDFQITYSKDWLKFLNFDNTHSIVNIWQPEPALLTDGNIHLTGGMFKPFMGENGLIMKLSFKALKAGQTKLSFDKSDIFIADGKGTKLPMNTPSLVLSIVENDSKLINNVTTPIVSSLPPTIDNSPPEILLERTISPVDNSSLIVFHAADPESGIKQVQMRIKKWFIYSSWQDVQNPVLYPVGAWRIELKAVNNSGLESVKSLTWMGEFLKKILIIIFICICLVFGIVRVYNNIKRKL